MPQEQKDRERELFERAWGTVQQKKNLGYKFATPDEAKTKVAFSETPFKTGSLPIDDPKVIDVCIEAFKNGWE